MSGSAIEGGKAERPFDDPHVKGAGEVKTNAALRFPFGHPGIGAHIIGNPSHDQRRMFGAPNHRAHRFRQKFYFVDMSPGSVIRQEWLRKLQGLFSEELHISPIDPTNAFRCSIS